MREFYHCWGVSEEVSLDGGPNLDSSEMKRWLKSWGTNIRTSAAYYPQSNGRAEAGVKSLKRLLRGNTGRNGSINTDSVARALLQYRNTPLRGVDKSPAELALGRQLRDTLPLPRDRYEVSNQWEHHLRHRERIMSTTNTAIKTKYDEQSKELTPLKIGDEVRCQNTRTKKWDRTGTVLETALVSTPSEWTVVSGRLPEIDVTCKKSSNTVQRYLAKYIKIFFLHLQQLSQRPPDHHNHPVQKHPQVQCVTNTHSNIGHFGPPDSSTIHQSDQETVTVS